MTMKLNMLPPSVNNMSVRVFVRAAGLPYEEENVWGQTKSDEYLAKFPTGLTPSIETPELPKGGLSESCAVMMYLGNREGLEDLYPSDLGRRAMVDAANSFTISMLYPLVARATYPRLGFAGYPGEVSTSDASEEAKEAARKAAEDDLPRHLDVYPQFFLNEAGFIGGDSPDDRGHPPRLHAGVPGGRGHAAARLGAGLHAARGVGARGRVYGARGRRARLHRAGDRAGGGDYVSR